MDLRTWILVAAIAGLTTPALADEVAPGEVTTFQANTPAIASEVNSNFQALIAAINDNAQRVAALEAAVTPVDNDVTGHTYRFFNIESAVMNSEPDAGWDQSGAFASEGTITFGAGGTGTLDEAGAFAEPIIGAPGDPIVAFSDNDTFNSAITWSQVGETVTMTDSDSDTTVFTVTENGLMMVATNIELDAVAPAFDWNLVIAVRVP
ncbi:MAG: hypothetical protein MJE66_10025 [Proteobacteria bacterium]|nr:hypothetical protein [Pseudomonadota bacterium]